MLFRSSGGTWFCNLGYLDQMYTPTGYIYTDPNGTQYAIGPGGTLQSIKDLNGKTVGVQAGSALLARLPELGGMLEKEGGKLGKIVEYTSYPEAYQDLALGRVDYVVNTIINLQTLVNDKPAVFELGQAVSGKSFPAWAVAKGNTELLDFLNGFIAAEKKSGRFAELQKKWFGESFPNLPVQWEPEF